MMKCIPFNIRGLGDHSKFVSLRSFLLENGSIMVLVQETTSTADCIYAYFNTMFPTWHLVVVDAEGLSKGVAVMWDPNATKFSTYKFFAGIFLSGYIHGQRSWIHVINMYAPYCNHKTFWKRVIDFDILKVGMVVVAGDFNCTLSHEEGWGMYYRHDLLTNFISNIFYVHHLKDIKPRLCCPTWYNG